MPLNPFIEQVAQLDAQRTRLMEREATLSRDIEWVDTFDIGLAASDADQIANARAVIDRNIAASRQLGEGLHAELKRRTGYREEVMRKHAAELVRLSGLIPSALNPLGWFNDDRATFTAALRAAQAQMAKDDILLTLTVEQVGVEVRRHEEHVQRMRAEAEELGAEYAQVSERIGTYQAKSLGHLRTVLAETRAQREDVVRKLAEATQQRDNVEAQTRDVRRDIETALSRKAHLEARVARAAGFAARLDHADKADRWKIHRECDQALGRSNPSSVRDAASRELRDIERNLAKLDRRAKGIVRDASRLVHTVIFDGNNLCYSSEGFIGTGALQAAASSLSLSKKVVVVFDRSITKLTGSSAASIQAMFKPGIEVHVVQGNRAADEIVLDAASDETSVVVSNDRFTDFRDKAATRDRRVLTHEIVNGRVLIPQLGLSERFA